MPTENYTMGSFVTFTKDYIGSLLEGVLIALLAYLAFAYFCSWPLFEKRR